MSDLLSHPFLSRRNIVQELDKIPYIIIDIETTGLYPEKSEIIEIGAIKTDGLNAVDVFTTLIEPEAEIPKEIEALTGISQEMTMGKPRAKQALSELLSFIKNDVLVAHNSDFDIPFIKHHLQKYLKKDISNKVLCTVKIARAVVPEIKSYKLHILAEHLGVQVMDRHRAMGDAETTYEAWKKMIPLLLNKGIRTLAEAESLIK